MPVKQFDDSVKHGPTNTGVEEVMLRRWSPRAFASTPVKSADLEKIFTAASWAANSFNEQPWRFVLGKKGSATYDKIFKALVPGNQAWAGSAPVLFASFAKKTFTKNGSPNRVAPHDVGAASANLAIQATALGLSTHGMAGFDPKVLAEEFSVPEDFEPVACWALGYLGDPETLPDQLKAMEVAPRERKGVQEFVFDEWEKPASL